MDSLQFQVYLGWRHWLGLEWTLTRKREFLYYLHNRGWGNRNCDLCGLYVKRKDRSLDHIIPQSTCFDIGLPELCVDHRNFQLAHADCNTKKGASHRDLPESIKAVIAELQTKQTSGMLE